MKACVPENKLIRLVAGELAVGEREEVMSHLGSCAHCRSAWEELRATWDVLGRDSISLPEADLTGRVLAAAAVLPSRTRWKSTARAAAIVLLAGGIGIAAGLLTPARPGHVGLTASVSDEQIVEALGLDAINADTGLLTGVLEADESDTAFDQEQAS